MKIPQPLKAGDQVGVVCTARAIDHEKLEFAIEQLKKWELKPVIGKTVGIKYHQFAGRDKDRANDLQTMLDNPDIKAIICAKGGYGTTRILDLLDLTEFKKNPKWLTGFSDVTALHSHFQQVCETASLHAPLCSTFARNCDLALDTMRQALFGEKLMHTLGGHELNRNGSTSAILVGGNLSVLYSILGSKSDIDTKGKILFLEDLDEYLYHIDRMIVGMKRAGKFDNLAGLIIGGMSKMKDNDIPFGKTPREIIAEHTAEYKYPICFGFQAGHIEHNRTLVLGAKHRFIVDEVVSLKQL